MAISGRSSAEFRIARNVASRGEVEALMEGGKRKAAQNTS
jgi:hypothetical protein